MRNLLLKIQKLPESKRKIILWVIIAVLALALLSVYVKNAQKRLGDVDLGEIKRELQPASLKEELEKLPKIEMPKIEIPEINQEKLQELEQAIKEAPI